MKKIIFMLVMASSITMYAEEIKERIPAMSGYHFISQVKNLAV